MDNEPLLHEDVEPTSERHDGASQRSSRFAQYLPFFAYIFFFKFLAHFTIGLLELPLLRLLERAICQRHFTGLKSFANIYSSSEDTCKDAAIQDELAMVVGFKSSFDSVPCLLAALFYGALADKRGRKFVLVLSVSGQVLALAWIALICFPDWRVSIQLVWLSSAFLFVGGGSRVELSMIYTTFFDAVRWEQRAHALFYLHTATHSARLVAPPIGAYLMSKNLGIPFILAATTLFGRYLLLYYIPETSLLIDGAASEQSATPQRDTPEDDASDGRHMQENFKMQHSKSLKERIYDLWSRIRYNYVWNFCSHRGLCILFACFAVKRIGFASELLTFQYASETQHRSISSTFWLRVANALGATFVLSVMLPMITQILTIKRPDRDIWVVRGSLMILISGFFALSQGRNFVALCLGMALCGLGEGLEAGLQSIGTYIVGGEKHAPFFAFVSILDVVGDLLGGPIMAGAYTIRRKDGLPAGFCFVLSAVLFGFLLALTKLIKTTRLRWIINLSDRTQSSLNRMEEPQCCSLS